MTPENSKEDPADVSIDQSGQTIEGHQVNVGGDARIDHVGDKISGDVVITGQVDGDVHITYAKRPEIPAPPPPPPLPQTTLFVGREAELAHYSASLDQAGIAVISGMAGAGKTTLAAELARRAAQKEKIFWHSFHEGEGVEGIIWRLAGFLALNGDPALWTVLNNALLNKGNPPPPELLFDYLVQLVRGKGYLLCLDDFQYIDENPLLNQLVAHLRPLLLAGELKVIITSRQVPDFVQLISFEPLAGLNVSDLGQMLAASGFYLEADQMEQMVRYTGGNAQMLTLAIDLLLSGLEAQELLARLVETDDIEDFLMDEVESRLTRNERLAMSAVAILGGYPGSRAAIEAILDGRRLRRVLRDLSDRFLLTVSLTAGERKYNQHAIVRDFFYEALHLRERNRLHLRAAAYYRDQEDDALVAARHYYAGGALMEAADLATDDVQAIINHGQARQLNNLLARFARDDLDRDRWIAVKLAGGQGHAYFGENEEARVQYEAAQTEMDNLPQTAAPHQQYGDLCYAMGDLLRQQDPQKALAWFERGLAVAGATDQQKAALNIGEGAAHAFLEQFAEAQTALESGLALLDQQPSQLRATAVGTLGIIFAEYLGDLDKAITLTEEALAITRQLGDRFTEAQLLSTLGTYKHDAKDWSGAMVDFELAHTLANQLGNDKILAMTSSNMGHALFLAGAYEAAERHLNEALNLFERTEERIFACQTMVTVTQLHLQRQEWAAAADVIDSCAQEVQDLGADYLHPWILRAQAEIAASSGDLTSAVAKGREALELSRESDDDEDIGLSLYVWGRVMAAVGNILQAGAAFEESVERLQAVDLFEAARGQVAWGRVLVSNGKLDKGTALLNAARSTFERLGAQGELAALDKEFGR